MSTEPENPGLLQEDDHVSHLGVILGMLVVFAVTAAMIVWAWATTDQGLAERRPGRDFPDERLGPRKDVLGVRRLATSLMPSFAEGLKPSDVADLLAWLRSNLQAGASKSAGTPKAAQ